MGAIFSISFLTYAVICMLAVPAALLGRLNDERECEASHDVFDCELVETWVPVAPAGDEAVSLPKPAQKEGG
jgi:hypothetical protein